MFTLEKIWHVNDAERVFFSGYKQLKGLKGDDFDGTLLANNKNLKEIQITAEDEVKSVHELIESGKIQMPEKIIVMT